MTHFYPLTIKEVKQETSDCVSIAFTVPNKLTDIFAYTQGQYLTLKATINGEELRRSYSICSSPLDTVLRVAVKQVAGGLFSGYANAHLKAGDQLQVMPPMGRFFVPLDPAHKKGYVAIAAGSGITPILSIIKTTLLTEPLSRFLLVYSNRWRKSIIFKDELDALKNKFVDRLSIVHLLSREKMDAPLNIGRMDAAKCTQLFGKIIDLPTTDEFFICGPEEMTLTVKAQLQQHGVESEKIHIELFTAAVKADRAFISKTTMADTEEKSLITVKLDGTAFSFDLGRDSINILDAAMEHGADLPYSCKSGVCCTCRAKLVEGEVTMEVNYGLEPDEIEQGFILTCQSHPTSPRVVIDFDVK